MVVWNSRYRPRQLSCHWVFHLCHMFPQLELVWDKGSCLRLLIFSSFPLLWILNGLKNSEKEYHFPCIKSFSFYHQFFGGDHFGYLVAPGPDYALECPWLADRSWVKTPGGIQPLTSMKLSGRRPMGAFCRTFLRRGNEKHFKCLYGTVCCLCSSGHGGRSRGDVCFNWGVEYSAGGLWYNDLHLTDIIIYNM